MTRREPPARGSRQTAAAKQKSHRQDTTATAAEQGTARILRFRGQLARRRLVVANLRDARQWIDAGLAGSTDLAGAVTEAFIALNAANAEVLRADIEEVAS